MNRPKLILWKNSWSDRCCPVLNRVLWSRVHTNIPYKKYFQFSSNFPIFRETFQIFLSLRPYSDYLISFWEQKLLDTLYCPESINLISQVDQVVFGEQTTMSKNNCHWHSAIHVLHHLSRRRLTFIIKRSLNHFDALTSSITYRRIRRYGFDFIHDEKEVHGNFNVV